MFSLTTIQRLYNMNLIFLLFHYIIYVVLTQNHQFCGAIRKLALCYKIFLSEALQGCRNAHNVYHKVRKLYNEYKTLRYKNILKSVSKDYYKHTISLSARKFKQYRVRNLKKLRSNNPKEYWKIINSIDKRKNPAVSIEDFYTFFNDINSDESYTVENTENDSEKMELLSKNQSAYFS